MEKLESFPYLSVLILECFHTELLATGVFFILPIHPSFHLISILFVSSAAASVVLVQILQIPQNSCLYTEPLEYVVHSMNKLQSEFQQLIKITN